MSQLELPKGWINCQFKDIVCVNPKVIANDEDLSGFIPMSHAPVNFFDSFKYDERNWGEIKKKYTNFADGDVIFAKVTPCFENGKAALLEGLPNGIGAGSSEFYVLRPLNSTILSKYVFSVIKSADFLINGERSMTGAVGLRRVPRSFVENFEVNLPPLAEQKVIADKLDTLLAQVESIKARLEQIPEILKQFRQSVLAAAVNGKLTEEWREKASNLKQVVIEGKYTIDENYSYLIPDGWCLTSIANTSSFQQGLQIAKNTRRNELEDGVLPILRTVNYENGFSEDVHYALVDNKSIIAEADDIILSRTGTVGRVLTGYRGIMHNNSFRLNYNNQLLKRDYLIYFLNSPSCQQFIVENSGRSSQPDLTHKAFSKCPISIPSLEEQEEIIRRIGIFFTSSAVIEKQVQSALDRVNNLTQSILAKAFRGELTAEWREAHPELISDENSAEALLERIKAERAAKPVTKRGRGKA
ncbi:restriction endonuclease subunit S [Acinetobacter baumannii]|uniref:restriction endonuclease subunit S n=1 Tax=Acinetobacter baumannii TaxID=470 RepID=UPI00280CB720|nr:restriction endonuclease subunit S [Acinetobacter baumannii]MDQ8917487.1 restriction endonuclease subunit S [Acinetobacter baumannii]MDQ8948267.1 restriction endonuclease subunit S [Acinetobacter baumannii]MDQ8962435.1 restriction endonuclease subunit S [Acinetobacter baumannii]MDQ8966122.1 restriction endonuclease subunit S [Acinetobacter baumannii]MDQ8980302.1 restriction endonuclease subunit S [Acinetobacter baumannii]